MNILNFNIIKGPVSLSELCNYIGIILLVFAYFLFIYGLFRLSL